jgi:hypothetical protein
MVDETPDDDEEDGDANDDVSLKPNENADPQEIVDRKVPQSIRDKYEVFSYRNAAVILAEARQAEFAEIVAALDAFKITTEMIRTAGGNESDIPKEFTKTLRPLGWYETVISADLHVTLSWREPTGETTKTLPVNFTQRADESVAVLAADFTILVAMAMVETWFAHAALPLPQPIVTRSRSIAIRCKPSSVRTSPPKTSLA